jgi:hypothetical protein
MRLRLRTALLLAVAGALTAGSVVPAAAAPASTSWAPDLRAGEAAGVSATADGAQLDPDSAHLAPQDDTTTMTEGAQDADPSALVPTGYLTLDPRHLSRPTDRVDSTLVAQLPPGSEATVDVRGRRANGGWTEWIPSTPAADDVTGADRGTEGAPDTTEATAELPEATTEVQSRLVLSGDPGAEPVVSDLRLSAHPAPATEGVEDVAGGAETAALRYSVFATREGLVGGTTSNGHVITERDHFVALPSRRALSPRNTSDYSVKVCAANGRCAFAPVWDVGPWNTRDDYWNPAPTRENWGDLPQGTPQAQAAYRNGYNGGADQFGRKLVNPAGIDLADGVFWDALGLKDNSQVTVDYLWTGSVRLSKVAAEDAADGLVNVFAGPGTDTKVVGVAADSADVPVVCSVANGGWLQIGDGQYVIATAVPGAGAVKACPSAG